VAEFFDMTALEMRREIATIEAHLQNIKTRLERAERECQHAWGKVAYCPIETKGFQTQGDPPGTMGVDWQGPMWIEPTCTKQWSRTCSRCGKVQTTKSTRKERTAGAIPGTSGDVDVPDFGDRQYEYNAANDTGPHWGR
jgi:hypothetical protein